MAKDIVASLSEEPQRWKLGYCTFDRDDGVAVWRANLPIIDVALYRPFKASLGFTGKCAVYFAFRRWLHNMPLAGYKP